MDVETSTGVISIVQVPQHLNVVDKQKPNTVQKKWIIYAVHSCRL